MDYIILIIILALIVLFSMAINSDQKKLLHEAEKKLHEKLKNKPVLDLSVEFEQEGIAHEKALSILDSLTKATGTSEYKNKFHLNDKVGEIFRVKKEEIVGFDKVWRKAGLGGFIELYSDEFLSGLNRLFEDNASSISKAQQYGIDVENMDENELLEKFMDMEILKFIKIFL